MNSIKKISVVTALMSGAFIALPNVSQAGLGSLGNNIEKAGIYFGIDYSKSNFKYKSNLTAADFSFETSNSNSTDSLDLDVLSTIYGEAASNGDDNTYYAKNFDGIGFFVGVNINKVFAIQLSYSRYADKELVLTSDSTRIINTDGNSDTAETVSSINSTAGYQEFGLTAIVYYDLIDDFQIFGLAGIEYIDFKATHKFSGLSVENDAEDGSSTTEFSVSNNSRFKGLGYKIGAGISFDVTDSVSIQGKYEYVFAAGLDNVDRFWVIGAGIKLSF